MIKKILSDDGVVVVVVVVVVLVVVATEILIWTIFQLSQISYSPCYFDKGANVNSCDTRALLIIFD